MITFTESQLRKGIDWNITNQRIAGVNGGDPFPVLRFRESGTDAWVEVYRSASAQKIRRARDQLTCEFIAQRKAIQSDHRDLCSCGERYHSEQGRIDCEIAHRSKRRKPRVTVDGSNAGAEPAGETGEASQPIAPSISGISYADVIQCDLPAPHQHNGTEEG